MHYGVDVSSAQHPNDLQIDWPQVNLDLKSRGSGDQPFTLIKLTESTTYLNPFALGDATGAKNSGFVVAFYHFMHAEVSGAEQLAWIKTNLPAGHGIFLDLEGGGLNGKTVQDMFNEAESIINDPVVLGVYLDNSWRVICPPSLLVKAFWFADPSNVSPATPRQITQIATGSVNGIAATTDVNTAVDLNWAQPIVPAAPVVEPTPQPVIEATPVQAPAPQLSWIQEVINNMPTIAENSTDVPFAKRVQGLLNANGSNLAVDGAFGPMTLREVLAFQYGRGLTADGIVGPITWTALLGV